MHSEAEFGARRAAGRTLGALARDYFTLTKPSIILLLLITTVPAMVLAKGGWPSTWLVIATLIGGMLAAGGAGAVNMYIDRDIDAIMQRTRSRPIPRGSITPYQALGFGIAQAVAAGVWLTITVNLLSAALAIAAFLFYTLVYSAYLKRTTVHNTVLGGAAGAMPPLIGWTAVTGTIGLEGGLLFLIVFYWQPPHFWALALGLADDYRAANIPMMPVVLGEHETKRQIVLYSIMTAALTLIFGVVAALGLLYLAVAAAGGAGFVWFAIRLYRVPGIGGTRAMFRYSTSYLALLFAAMVADRLLLG
ncbi:MAG: heme o synthase [Chloroflexi bacterium]|nr:heme o synthase [Chloroflexota bacterium]MDA1002478.1 heme o synthase [Chloroflexota bacterium]MQC27834.1 protoheme IX farnesyltransferase [Chloroflexota bacterium]